MFELMERDARLNCAVNPHFSAAGNPIDLLGHVEALLPNLQSSEVVHELTPSPQVVVSEPSCASELRSP